MNLKAVKIRHDRVITAATHLFNLIDDLEKEFEGIEGFEGIVVDPSDGICANFIYEDAPTKVRQIRVETILENPEILKMNYK
jgi:hypothetical protein